MRFSRAVVSVAAQGMGNAPEFTRAVKTLKEGIETLVMRGDADGAERQLNSIGAAKLPWELEATRFMLLGGICLTRNQGQAALDALDRAHDLRPDMPVLELMKGRAYSRLKNWDEAIKHFQAYRDLLGDDGELCRELGLALRWTGRFDEAAAVYRTALDLDPKDAEAFEGLLLCADVRDKKNDLGERFLKLDDLREHFKRFAVDCEKRNRLDLVEPLALALRKVDPQYPLIDYYLALVKARAGQAQEAVALFKIALARQPDDDSRRGCTIGFLQVMAKAGKIADGYAVAPDSQEAFRFAAAEALKQYRLDDLKRLVALHRKNKPDDPLLEWYQAAVYVREQRYALADRTFTAALVAPPDAQTLDSFRADRVTARYYAGLALAAYRDIGPSDETFKQLAQLAFQEENLALLEQLLDAHEKNDPQSVEVLRYRCRLKIKQGRIDEGIALFRNGLDRMGADKEQSRRWVSDFLYQMAAAERVVEGYRTAPDAKQAFLVLADDLWEEARHDDLRRLIEEHRKVAPADPWLALYQGDIDLADKAWDKAADGLWAGMKAAPQDMQEEFHWRVVEAMYRAGQWRRAYDQIKPHDKTFSQLGNLMLQDKNAGDLGLLCQVQLLRGADSAELSFYLSMMKVLAHQTDDAADLLAKACRMQSNEYQRRTYNERFVREMHQQGLMLEGYRAAPDQSAAFQTLAYELVAKKDEKTLGSLLSEHERGRDPDLWCEYYRGEWYLLRGEADKAAQRFASALKKSGPEDSWRSRDGLFRARVKSGQALAAYREIEPRNQTFEALASICVQEKAADQLQGLIEAYRKDNPGDTQVIPRELDVRWLKRDYEGVLTLLRQHGEDIFNLPRHRWTSDDYQVRSLVRLKRTQEAIQAAEAVVKHRGNRLLLVLAHAAAGDVKGTIAALEQPKSASHLVESCYHDPDLGPILRSDSFRSFREKFPESK